MKSRLIKAINYEGLIELPITEEIPLSDIESEVGHELKKLLLSSRRTEETDVVSSGDAATLTLSSSVRKFDRSGLRLNVGKNLFSREIEASLIGRRVGETYETEAGGVPVTVTVDACMRNIIPVELTDEIVASHGIEGASTVEEFKRLKEDEYKALYTKYFIEWHAMQLADKWFERSEFEIDEAEATAWYLAIDKWQKDELEFHNTMIAENYEGEMEFENRALAMRYLYGALMHCFMTGTDSGNYKPDTSKINALDGVYHRVLEPLERYLSGYFTIDWKEEE